MASSSAVVLLYSVQRRHTTPWTQHYPFAVTLNYVIAVLLSALDRKGAVALARWLLAFGCFSVVCCLSDYSTLGIT